MTDVSVTRKESVSPADAFSLLGNDLRVRILEELGDARDGNQPKSLSFEELRRACDVSDSGRFNYHLQELLDVFVTEDGDGYDLLYSGVILYRTIKSDAFTDLLDVEAFAVGADCQACGDPLEARYRNHHLLVECSSCGHRDLKYYLPPGVVRSGNREAILHAATQFASRDVTSIANDVCPTCGNGMEHEVVPVDRKESDVEKSLAGPVVAHNCDYCGRFLATNIPVLLLSHPAVVAHYYQRGIDVLSTPLWELDFSEPNVDIVDGESPRATVEFGGENEDVDVLRLELADHLDVDYRLD